MDDSDVDLEPQLKVAAKPSSQQALQWTQIPPPSQLTPKPSTEQSNVVNASTFQARPWHADAESSERFNKQPRIRSNK